MPFPIVDLFAGPGGLGEGFSSVLNRHGHSVFSIVTSIEKDPHAHGTLTLRSLVRKIRDTDAWPVYLDFMQGKIPIEVFLAHRQVAVAADLANHEAKRAELGKVDPLIVDRWIQEAIGDRDDWLLIGGPPCQAYSIAGRSRRTNDKNFEEDEKHFLYREYLRIIERFEPAAFVMENVKGMLTSKHGGSSIFTRILEDLSRPKRGLEYEIRSFAVEPGIGGYASGDYVIQSELYGVPQMRHRVILFGVRRDYAERPSAVLNTQRAQVTVGDMLEGLPRIRSLLTRKYKTVDSFENWINVVSASPKYLRGWDDPQRQAIEEVMERAIKRAGSLSDESESERLKNNSMSADIPEDLAAWIGAGAPPRAVHHEPRAHMESDLHRYLFAAAYATVNSETPKLRNFPPRLLPDHVNILDDGAPFDDRFRVQVAGRPSTTVVSHIAKDGHYYIHPDPSQCRSLTVREAARLQTFPDNYFFMGNRTQQYQQVGNAVPPYLARQIGDIVARVMMGRAT